MPKQILDIISGVIRLIPIIIKGIKGMIAYIKMKKLEWQRKKLNNAESPGSWSDFFKR